MDQSIQHENTILHYGISGTGSKPLLVFHGFGQNHMTFSELFKKISTEYKIYSFDIFFHGNSEWNQNEKPLEKLYWKKLLGIFLRHHKIDRFSVFGFSMGGKFALASLEAFPEKTENIFLLAPDGIKISPWYTLATSNSSTRQLFKSMILKPERFHWIANLAFKLGFIDKGILRFVESQMNTQAKREQVYYSWVVFRYLKFDMSRVASLINSNNIGLTIYVGKYDQVITAKSMEGLLTKVSK
ncbi:MAG TPA: alpha/beta hydrolase, partial [Cyclobacteriaceae bacterium]|nr:alpha/beta hydrolase [Cyclobacteriaceae bacterium]